MLNPFSPLVCIIFFIFKTSNKLSSDISLCKNKENFSNDLVNSYSLQIKVSILV